LGRECKNLSEAVLNPKCIAKLPCVLK
jgi:hypothetical protein